MKPQQDPSPISRSHSRRSAFLLIAGGAIGVPAVLHSKDVRSGKASAGAGNKGGADTGTLRVVVSGLRNSKGHVLVSLYDRSKGFPRSREAIADTRTIKSLNGSQVEASFENLPFGDYAIAILHDEDKSGEMTYRMRVLPGEGYGFSNNPKVVAKAPSFDTAKFSFRKDGQKTQIKLKY